MTGNRKKFISKFTIQRYGETPGSSECLGASSRRTTTCRERFGRLINPNATDVAPVIPSAVEDPSPAGDATSTKTAACEAARHIEARSPSCWSEETCGGQSDVLVSKESSCDSSSSTPDLVAVACRDGDVPVPEDAMEA